MNRAQRAAHFLLVSELADSPPNDALVSGYREVGLEVDLFAPAADAWPHGYGPDVSSGYSEYGYRWLARQARSLRWRQYSVFSGTAEDPLAVAGVLAVLNRRPLIVLADEIKSGAYRGDTRGSWKWLCRWAMRRADLTIVNDPARIELQRQYAGLNPRRRVLVYPGGYRTPPEPAAAELRSKRWGVAPGAIVIGFSGTFNLLQGADWLLEALQRDPGLHAVIQPVGIDDLHRFLLSRVEPRDRVFVEPQRLGWREAWSQAAAMDIGVVIYRNPGPQFQLMGTSSNRLCMYLAMGVPVIASRQPSFEFLERYDCGILVENSAEFAAAVGRIGSRLPQMRTNARRCWTEYVDTQGRYRMLSSAIEGLLAPAH